MTNIKCIIHLADIHIRNFARLDEYSEQLTKRAEARVRIREIEKEIADEESASE